MGLFETIFRNCSRWTFCQPDLKSPNRYDSALAAVENQLT